MKYLPLILTLFAVVFFVNGQVVSGGLEKLKEGVVTAGAVIKGVGGEVVDSVVGKLSDYVARSLLNICQFSFQSKND